VDRRLAGLVAVADRRLLSPIFAAAAMAFSSVSVIADALPAAAGRGMSR
jgi:cation transport ATPase